MSSANQTERAEGGKGIKTRRYMGLLQGNTEDTLKSENVLTKQQRIAELARQMPGRQLWSLSYYIDYEWMCEAYRRTRKDGSAGVDGVTAAHYEKDLEGNLKSLLDRFKTGSYRAQPVKRVYIVKDEKTGEKRPIGIPALEDKILERAVLMVLEPLYEVDFLDSSNGFRPKRSVHQTLEKVWKGIMGMGGCWILEVDIRKFFDTVDHQHLRAFLSKRVGDGVIRRTIGKWLKAGIAERGSLYYPEEGTPQGSVISPLLSNIYLHEVLDTWFEREVKPRLEGRAELVRFADDYIIMFQLESDAKRVAEVTPKRFEKYGLSTHPEKTKIVDFRKPIDQGSKTATFQFLGFTHYWGRSRRGNWVVMRSTSGKKLRRSNRAIFDYCKRERHKPIKEQHLQLSRKMRGHYAFYGITNNYTSIKRYSEIVKRTWKMWLNRRNRNNEMNWEKFNLLLRRYPLPSPRIVHSYV